MGSHDLLTVFLGSLATIFAVSELGRWFGIRAGERGSDQIQTMETAILGLLALMIAFTFAMALARFDSRREGVLTEANDIGTTALRARLLPAPYNAETLELLREYVKVRLEVAQRVPTEAEFDAALGRSSEIQEALWQQAMAIATKNQELVPTGLFIDSLNRVIDDQEKRLTALRNRVPNVVLLALYAVAAVAAGFSGYVSGLQPRSSRVPVYLMIVVVCGVILLIQDLDRPNTGFITTSQQPMIDAAAAIAKY